MTGFQCDNCRTFAPSTPAGWFILARIDPAPAFSGFLSALSGSAPSQPDSPATFCSARCVAEYAYVLTVTGNAGSTP